MKKEQLEKCRSSGRRTLSPRSTLAGQGGDFVPLARHSLPLHSSPSSPLIQNKNDPAKAGSFFLARAEGLEPSTKALETHVWRGLRPRRSLRCFSTLEFC